MFSKSKTHKPQDTPPKKTTPPSTPTSLPSQIAHFLALAAYTPAYKQRSHKHGSLLSAYRVSCYLHSAALCTQPLKRNAALRDAAQKLHLWPGDVQSELRRDALVATRLLDAYVRETLIAEVRFVNGVVGKLNGQEKEKEEGRECVRELESVHRSVLNHLGILGRELDRLIKQPLEHESGGQDEMHDLMPFIPGFTNPRLESRDPCAVEEDNESVVEKDEDDDFVLLSRAAVQIVFVTPEDKKPNTLKAKAMEDVNRFLESTKVIAGIYTIVANNTSLDGLSTRLDGLDEVRGAFERMEMSLFDFVDGER